MSIYKQLQNHQEVLDTSDMFFVEWLVEHSKDEEKLQETLARIQKECEIANRSSNHEAQRMSRERLNTITSFLELKRLSKIFKDQEKNGDDAGGVSLY